MILIDPLTLDDISAAMTLVSAAGWNQTPADWRRVIEYQPHGCFKASLDSRLVGTVTSTSYGDELAWIGMMLVDPALRRQGIGRALMQQVIAALRAMHVKTIKLDATPAGRPLYEQLGFVAQFDFERWQRPSKANLRTSIVSSPIERLQELYALDRQAFGVDRQAWLAKLASGSCCLVDADGYGMLRTGRVADYLGPIISGSTLQAVVILTQLVDLTSSSIFWDLPNPDANTAALARSLGFAPIRTLTRMSLGRDITNPNLSLQYAICDPATG